MASVAGYMIYERLLTSLGHGHPLWYPEPEARRGEISIGDVGFKKRGGFFRLFNITKPADDPVNHLGFPDNMPPFTINEHHRLERPEYLSAGPICSKTVRLKSAHADGSAGLGPLAGGGGLSFKVSDDEGALLVLKGRAALQEVHESRSLVRYIRAHHGEWYHYIADVLDYSVQREDVIVVSGWVKTAEWALAACATREAEGVVDVSFGAGPWASASAGFKVSGSSSMYIQHREGPSVSGVRASVPQIEGPEAEGETELPLDQTVFLHYYKVKYRAFIWPKVMRANAGPHEPPRGSGSDDDGVGMVLSNEYAEANVESMPPNEKCLDPVDCVLDYILENSSAEVAIASYKDLVTLCEGGPFPDDIPGFLQAQSPRIEVYDDGLGILWSESLDDAEVSEAGVSPITADTSTDIISTPGDDANPRHSESEKSSSDSEDRHPWRRSPTPPPRPRPSGSTTTHDSTTIVAEGPTLRMSGHTDTITCLACSPNSLLIASGSMDQTIRVWDAVHGTMLSTFNQHSETVWSVAFSPDSAELLSGSEDNLAIIWDVMDGQPRAILEGHENTIHCVAYAPDGRTAATASVDYTARLWNTHDGACRATLRGHTGMLLTVVFTPDSARVLTGSADFTARVWDAASGAPLHVLAPHGGVVWALAVSADGRRAVSGADDTLSRIWSLESGAELVALGENTGPVWSVAFAGDGARVLSAANDASVRVCDSFTGECVGTLPAEEPSDCCTPAFSRDGRRVVVSTPEKVLKVWDTETAVCIARLEGVTEPVKQLRFTLDGKRVVASSDDGSILVWELDIPYSEAHTETITL